MGAVEIAQQMAMKKKFSSKPINVIRSGVMFVQKWMPLL
jgi:hypothetical protein